MTNISCPQCKEEIRSDARLCRYCHQKLSWSREELLTAAIAERVRFVANATATVPSVSPCGALCHAKFANDKAALTRCLEDCEAIEAVAAVAERLQRELLVTFSELVWSGGDIDPVPFEKAVRKRFSAPRRP